MCGVLFEYSNFLKGYDRNSKNVPELTFPHFIFFLFYFERPKTYIYSRLFKCKNKLKTQTNEHTKLDCSSLYIYIFFLNTKV